MLWSCKGRRRVHEMIYHARRLHHIHKHQGAKGIAAYIEAKCIAALRVIAALSAFLTHQQSQAMVQQGRSCCLDSMQDVSELPQPQLRSRCFVCRVLAVRTSI